MSRGMFGVDVYASRRIDQLEERVDEELRLIREDLDSLLLDLSQMSERVRWAMTQALENRVARDNG